MRQELPVRSEWQQHVVATRTRTGHVFVLLGVRKSTCEVCRYGEHFETTWGSTTGEANRITWCRSCFNAECTGAELEDHLQPFWDQRVSDLSGKQSPDYWNGARPAIDDLERRGLI